MRKEVIFGDKDSEIMDSNVVTIWLKVPYLCADSYLVAFGHNLFILIFKEPYS